MAKQLTDSELIQFIEDLGEFRAWKDFATGFAILKYRLHPDNKDTGNLELFKKLQEAMEVLRGEANSSGPHDESLT